MELLKEIVRSLLKPGQNLGQLTEKAHQMRQDIINRYGEKNATKATEIATAERELKECEGCSGKCQKKFGDYFKPVIEVENGEVYISQMMCRYGLERKMLRMLKKNMIPTRYAGKMLVDYEVTDDNKSAVQKTRWYLSQRPNKSLYFYGGTGTGKTFLAVLIAQEFLRNYLKVVFGDVPSLLDAIKETFDGKEESTEDLMKRYEQCDLLILDDFGIGKMTAWSVKVLYQLINSRYNQDLPIVVTSNYSMDELESHLKVAEDEYTGPRLVSRLSEMCVCAYFGEVDRRKS